MANQYLSEPEIVRMLRARRKGFKTIKLFWLDVQRVTGMAISYSHLFNILTGRLDGKKGRAPNECVLRYLGGSNDRVYQIGIPIAAKRKANRR